MQQILVGALIFAAALYLVRRVVRNWRKRLAVSSCAGCLGCPKAMDCMRSVLADQPAQNQLSSNSPSPGRPPLMSFR